MFPWFRLPCHKLLCAFLVLSILNVQASPKSDGFSKDSEDPAADVDYKEFWGISGSWLFGSEHLDNCTEFGLVTYTYYAESLKEFIEKYPTFTVNTTGKAFANETAGDVGHGRFGMKTFATKLFNNTNYTEVVLVDHEESCWTWRLHVKIGFSVKVNGDRFYMKPFVYGRIRGYGYTERVLKFGLSITKVIFNKKSLRVNENEE